MALLSGQQKAALAITAKQSWASGGHAEQSEASAQKDAFGMIEPESKRFETWRRSEAIRCCGKSISQADNRHYRKLANWFAALANSNHSTQQRSSHSFHSPAQPKPLFISGQSRTFSSDRHAQGTKIQALLLDNQRTWEYADGIAKRMYSLERIEWCRPPELQAIITALIKSPASTAHCKLPTANLATASGGDDSNPF
ncbi:MAG: phage protein GemA/Gp16 family protein [Verrucomicrobiota bacterium]|nr:phage protein GemA/Gp16 family protein [Verrucomicrobiota bacterium]